MESFTIFPEKTALTSTQSKTGLQRDGAERHAGRIKNMRREITRPSRFLFFTVCASPEALPQAAPQPSSVPPCRCSALFPLRQRPGKNEHLPQPYIIKSLVHFRNPGKNPFKRCHVSLLLFLHDSCSSILRHSICGQAGASLFRNQKRQGRLETASKTSLSIYVIFYSNGIICQDYSTSCKAAKPSSPVRIFTTLFTG